MICWTLPVNRQETFPPTASTTDVIKTSVCIQIRSRINSKLTWSEGTQSWRKDGWLCRRQREGSRSGALRRRERSERGERRRPGRPRRGGRKRRRGGWSDRGSWRGKEKRSDRERSREKRWGVILCVQVWISVLRCHSRKLFLYTSVSCVGSFQAAQRELERQRKEEWERRRRGELQIKKEQEQDDIIKLKAKKRSLEMELEAVVSCKESFFHCNKHVDVL